MIDQPNLHNDEPVLQVHIVFFRIRVMNLGKILLFDKICLKLKRDSEEFRVLKGNVE